jgi:hypothetical protein
MMDDFTTAEIQTDETSILVRSYGSGPPLIVQAGVGSSARSWSCGALRDRLILGMSRSPHQSCSGETGAMMFKGTPSTPDTFSRKRLPNKPLTH